MRDWKKNMTQGLLSNVPFDHALGDA